MNIFSSLLISEHTGHGLPIIVGSYGKDAVKFSDNGITICIPFETEFCNDNIDTNKTINTANENCNEYDYKFNNNINIKLNKTQIKIINILKGNNKTTIKELASILALSDSSIIKNLNKLKYNGIIKRIGSDKTGFWEIIN